MKPDFQQLWRPPRQPRGDDARHVRHRAREEPDDPAKADGTRSRRPTLFQPGNQQLSIYDAAMKYIEGGTPTWCFGGDEYGNRVVPRLGRQGHVLLGVKAVVARSYERIHRSNLVGMGVLPLQFKDGESAESLGITGDEVIDVVGVEAASSPRWTRRSSSTAPTARRRKSRCWCASTRRSRSTTTCTAASCLRASRAGLESPRHRGCLTSERPLDTDEHG
jgi:aconitase A